MLTKHHKQRIRLWLKRLQQQNPELKPRASQNQMIADIARCITGEHNRSQRIMVAESGTGSGKSIAYLLATIPIALKMNKTVIVSTATIALQQQLIETELPRIHQAGEGVFRFSLAKGRGRYCCRHKLNRLIMTTPPQLRTYRPLLQQLSQALASNRWFGDIDSCPTTIPDGLWRSIQADAFSCHSQLPRHRSCPLPKARSGLLSSQVIVTNHSLLLTDLQAGGGVFLPEPEDCIYILDEAHRFAPIAREQSACRFNLTLFLQQLSEGEELFKAVEKRLSSFSITQVLVTIRESISATTPLLMQLNQFSQNHSHLFNDKILRFALFKLPKQLSDLAHNHIGSAQKLNRGLEQLTGLIQGAVENGELLSAAAEKILSQLFKLTQLSEQLCDSLYHYSRDPSQFPLAYWLEREDKGISLCSSPMEVGGIIYNMLFKPAFSVIAISATIKALGNFDFFLKEMGLSNQLPKSQLFDYPSPFDYSRVSLRLPTIFSEPDSPEFPSQIAQYIVANDHDNSALLVLCSSYALIHQLKQALESHAINDVRFQGEQSNQQLLTDHKEAIKQGRRAVLVATMGFSEGIDLPGNSLTHLIIPRLPFSVPTDPVHQTYSELLARRGENPFMQLVLPLASRKLIQSCGRLMRNESDSGIITILDTRMATRRYGQQLLAALPPYTKSV